MNRNSRFSIKIIQLFFNESTYDFIFRTLIDLGPSGVSMYPVTPTTLSAGVSMMVTGSTTSFLLMAEPGFSAVRTTWVIPAL